MVFVLSLTSHEPCRCFHGDISTDEVEELLASEPMGTYLFRFGPKKSNLYCSYFDGDRVVHIPIKRSTISSSLVVRGETFDSLQDFIDRFKSSAFFRPFPNLRQVPWGSLLFAIRYFLHLFVWFAGGEGHEVHL